MHRSRWGAMVIALSLVISAPALRAQLVPMDPDWREVDAPTPPAVKTTGLIPLELPGSTLRFGVDPSSVSLDSDGIVRYVVVAASASGAVNGLYEGIRCNTGEFKVYARHNPGSGWVVSKNADWRAFTDVPSSRHSLLVARSGACIGHGPNRSAAQIVRDLKSPIDSRFNLQPR